MGQVLVTQEDGVCADLSVRFKPTPGWKRMIDVAGSLFLLVGLSPLIALVSASIKLSSPGPVLFRQRRLGAAGQLFTMWKFRTMCAKTNADRHKEHVAALASSGKPLNKIDSSNDYIRFGQLWRATGIDELPQLINVLRGEMSLVGPRPDVLSLEDYEHWQLRRFEVVPGLTGHWQVEGKNRTTFDEMIQLDIEYVDKRNLGLDVMILLKTIPATIRYARMGKRTN